MKIKVGDQIYSGAEQPIMVILTGQDKLNITRMQPEADRYAMWPDVWGKEEIEKWMDAPGNEEACGCNNFKLPQWKSLPDEPGWWLFAAGEVREWMEFPQGAKGVSWRKAMVDNSEPGEQWWGPVHAPNPPNP